MFWSCRTQWGGVDLSTAVLPVVSYDIEVLRLLPVILADPDTHHEGVNYKTVRHVHVLDVPSEHEQFMQCLVSQLPRTWIDRCKI